MIGLMKTKGAGSFLIAVFLNAFVDLGHKIIIQNTIFKIYDGSTQVILTAVVNGLILLPFILLFTPAGFLSDKYPKHAVMRYTAASAVLLTLGITACYYAGWFWPAFAMTFALAVQSAFYSPAKYGFIKSLFGKEKLAKANGMVQAISIMAILAGTLCFTVLFEYRYPVGSLSEADVLKTIAPIGWLLVLNSVIEWFFMCRLPSCGSTGHGQPFRWHEHLNGKLMRESFDLLAKRTVILRAIVGLSMFWSVGQVLLAAFPAYAKESLAVSNTIVIQGVLASSGIGIALGALWVGRRSQQYIATHFIPIGAVGIVLGLFLLPQLGSVSMAFFNFLLIGAMGGFFIVPLNALIQFHAGEHELGSIIAVNNWVQNIAMMSFLILTIIFSLAGVSSRYLLFLITAVALLGGAYTVFKLPQSLLRLWLAGFARHRFHLQVSGLNNLPGRGGGLLVVSGKSWMDWLFIQMACPRLLRFYVSGRVAESSRAHYLLHRFAVMTADLHNSERLAGMVAADIHRGELVCLIVEEQQRPDLIELCQRLERQLDAHLALYTVAQRQQLSAADKQVSVQFNESFKPGEGVSMTEYLTVELAEIVVPADPRYPPAQQ